jgi:ABC-type uncharacterized transport system substrate-binding protein
VADRIFEPIETGIVKSLARPGGNVTGLTWEEGTHQATKKLELFKQLVPTSSRVASMEPDCPGVCAVLARVTLRSDEFGHGGFLSRVCER